MSSNGHADAELAGSLSDTDQHDIHNADTANQKRHAGNGRQQRGHDFGGGGGHLGDVFLTAHHEVRLLVRADAVALREQAGDLRLDVRHGGTAGLRKFFSVKVADDFFVKVVGFVFCGCFC